MTRMLCRIALVAITLCLVACTDLPPPPVDGTGGSAGDLGLGGGDGTGGTGGIDPCAEVVLARTTYLEINDNVVPGGANGTVSAATDSIDRWSITTCGGSYDILLTWDEMGQGFDLDLFLLDSEEQVVGTGTPQGVPHDKEELTDVNLTADEQFFIEVQAVDTSGVDSLNYNLTVVPSD